MQNISKKLMWTGSFLALLCGIVKNFILPLSSIIVIIWLLIALIIWGIGFFLRAKQK